MGFCFSRHALTAGFTLDRLTDRKRSSLDPLPLYFEILFFLACLEQETETHPKKEIKTKLKA